MVGLLLGGAKEAASLTGAADASILNVWTINVCISSLKKKNITFSNLLDTVYVCV